MLHRVKSVTASDDHKLIVQFVEGVTKIYDAEPLFDKWTAFKVFETAPELFYDAEADLNGYGVIWNDDIDLSCDELFENGETIIT